MPTASLLASADDCAREEGLALGEGNRGGAASPSGRAVEDPTRAEAVTTDSRVVAVLRRWELFGGRWRVLARTESDVTVGLLTCDGGQEMSRVTATSDEFDAFLRKRKGSDHR